MIIASFRDNHDHMSNFNYSQMRVYSPALDRVVVFNTQEHLFQSSKTEDPRDKQWIIDAYTPGVAKRMGSKQGFKGRKIILRSDWNQIRYKMMLFGVRTKYRQNLVILDKLLATDDAYLIEGNLWHDNLWGDCQCKACINIKGQNWLGQVLMTVREENRNVGRL